MICVWFPTSTFKLKVEFNGLSRYEFHVIPFFFLNYRQLDGS